MPHYNSCIISSTSISLNGKSREIKPSGLIRLVQNGFNFRDWPVLKHSSNDAGFNLELSHWEYIPNYIRNEVELKEARIMNRRIIAKGEELLKNDKSHDSVFREGALYGRCLILSSGFFEWRHVPVMGKKGKPLAKKERIPYFITLRHRPEYFFMAGVSRIWTNYDRNQSADTFAVVTTEANELMAKVYNTKLRMPVIFTEELATQWLSGNLSEKQILELGSFRYAAEQMIAWPVAKDFMTKINPNEEAQYENLPPL
ncbi:MAG: SOS response-associated peptidase family protein [Chitinophagaceae bacterium]